MCACECLVYIATQVHKIKWVFHICDYALHTHTCIIYILCIVACLYGGMTVGLSYLFRLLNSTEEAIRMLAY